MSEDEVAATSPEDLIDLPAATPKGEGLRAVLSGAEADDGARWQLELVWQD